MIDPSIPNYRATAASFYSGQKALRLPAKELAIEARRVAREAARNRLPAAKAARVAEMKRAFHRRARQADLYRRDPEYRWRHSAPVAVVRDNPTS